MSELNKLCRTMDATMTSRSTLNLPTQIRVSIGSAVTLGFLKSRLETRPTTAYLMTYKDGKCTANCGFCPQARASRSRADMLSRVSWPIFPTTQVLNGLEKVAREGRIKRVCIQALNYSEVFPDLQSLVTAIREKTEVPISVSCQPISVENIQLLADAGAERIGIPLDAATQTLFDRAKGAFAGGPYRWEKQLQLLEEAVAIFGKGRVSTHLIVGLGETEKEMISIIQHCVDGGVLPALFAFTPVPGTALENAAPPSIRKYRRIQLARLIILQGLARFDSMRFDGVSRLADFGVKKEGLDRLIQSGEPFQTSGCPDCNRPYYNEKPSGPVYNYPRTLTGKELLEIRNELSLNEEQVCR